uniref:Uncharacterized protein n=1 Tax=Leersia perrieri TaxID=77586 RepID=A0A0D9W004_9ORYZ
MVPLSLSHMPTHPNPPLPSGLPTSHPHGGAYRRFRHRRCPSSFTHPSSSLGLWATDAGVRQWVGSGTVLPSTPHHFWWIQILVEENTLGAGSGAAMGKRSSPSSQADDQVGTEIRRWWQPTCRLQRCHLKSLWRHTSSLAPDVAIAACSEANHLWGTPPLRIQHFKEYYKELRVVCEDRNDFTTILQKPLPVTFYDQWHVMLVALKWNNASCISVMQHIISLI